MPISIQPPQPGDLITSSFMKQLIEQLQQLDARVTQLESVTPGAGGAVSISYMEPTDLQLGDTLRIHGYNFGLASENTVTFDGGSPFSQFLDGSGDRLLILKLPTLVFADPSHLFTVTVSNPRGSDSRQITIRQLPPTKLQGNVTPKLVLPTGTITSPVVFHGTITTDANLDETYNLSPSTVTGWSAVMVTDMSGNTVLPPIAGGPNPPPWQIRIPKSATVDVFVKLTIPVTSGTGFVKLDVTSASNPQVVFGSVRSPDFQVGQLAPPSPTLSFALTSISGPGARAIAADSFGFTVPTPTNQIDQLNFKIVGVKPSTSYTMALSFAGAANGWTASTKGSPWVQTTPQSWPTLTANFTTGAGDGSFPMSVNLASVGAATQAQLKITVTNDADPKDFGVYQPFVGP